MKNKKDKAMSRAAKMYCRTAQKGARKFRNFSPGEIAAARAELDGKIADLKAKADRLPAVKARKEQLEDRIERFYRDVAILAAMVAPEAFAKGDRDDKRAAINLALKRIKDTKSVIGEMLQSDREAEKRAKAEAEKAEFSKPRKGYIRAVKLVTGETKNWDRALDKWGRYVAARKVTPGSDLETVLGQYRERWEQRGWTPLELIEEIREFSPWWKQEKSARAKKAAKKRGRVKRPKSDLRFKETRKHKQGYCKVCGRKCKHPNQRVCDKHVKGSVLSFGTGSIDMAKFVK
jgi:hypothetical protein